MSKVIETKSRIYYLDFMRGLAVFFMVMQHTMIVHEYMGGEGAHFIGNIFVLLGTAPAAPIFMFIMGLFIMKSKRDDKYIFVRGLKLLALGYGLNLIRFTIPMLIAGEADAVVMLFGVDILQLAGLSFMMAAFLRKFAKNRFVIPVLVIVVLLVSPYLWGISDSNHVTDLLWGTGDNVAFPFFPWCIYPMLGMYLSSYLIQIQLDRKVKMRLLITGVIVGIVGLLTLDIFPSSDYSRYGLGASFLIISFVFLWLLVSEFITRKFKVLREGKVVKILFFWSENVTNVYIIQWVIFGWSMLVLGANGFNDIVAMFIGFLVMLITHLLLKHTKISHFIPKI